MWKVKIVIFIICMVVVVMPVAAQNPNEPCNGIDLHWLQKHVQLPPSKIITTRSIGNLCEVVLEIGNDMVGVYTGPDFVIAGEMFSKKTQVTQATLKAIRKKRDLALKKSFPELKSKLDKAAAFEYGAKGGRTLYMFTDPLCPYCTTAGSELKQMADTMGFSIKALLFNVHGDEGHQNAVAAVCRNYDFEQYLTPEWKKGAKGSADKCEKGENFIEQAKGIGRELGISGVPYFITDDGTIIRGADIKAIIDAIGS